MTDDRILQPQLPVGQDCQHHIQAYGGDGQLLGGGVRVHDGDGDGLGAVRAGCTGECGTNLKISQMT